MSFDPDTFVDELGQALALEAPDDVRNELFSNEHLASLVLGFQQAAKDGLRGVTAGTLDAPTLERSLRARKTEIVAAATAHASTIEKLVSQAISKVVERAREIRQQ